MIKIRRNLRKVVIVAICLAGSVTMFAQSNITDNGVKINGVIWATRNVDAFGTFAPTPESAGMFYQWGRPQAWAATGTVSGWRNFTSSEPVWTTENDPCPSGWRVPSRAEYESLMEAGSIWTTQNEVDGRVFGNDNNKIFLPAPGSRDYEDGMLWTGSGNYWTNTANSSPYSTAKYLGFGSVIDIWTATRACGFSVRCVKRENNTGINDVSAATATIVGYCNIMGIKLNEEPVNGFYIILFDNGTTKKVVKQ